MTKHLLAADIVSAAVRRIQLALGSRNRAEADHALEEAFRALPQDTIADEAGIGDLGLNARTCDALSKHDLCTVGELRDLGFDRLRALPGIGTATAQHVKAALRSFKVYLTRSGRKP